MQDERPAGSYGGGDRSTRAPRGRSGRTQSRGARRLGLALLLTAVPVLAGCRSLLLAAGPGFDAGTLAVGGVETGIGGQVEAIGFRGARATGLGFGAALEFGGYSTSGDADLIAFTTAEVRYRRELRQNGPFIGFGTGLGPAWSPGIHHAAIPLVAEAGLAAGSGQALFSVALRERLIALVGGGSPALDAFNSLQLVLGVTIDGGR